MRLGNSTGGNTGKKYIIRGKHDLKPVKGGSEKAGKFSEWFVKNFASLVCELKSKMIYMDDALTETYLRMYEGILYSGMEIQNYRSYYIRSYFTNYIQNSMKENRYCALPIYYDRAEEGYDFEMEKRQKQLEVDVFSYIYDHYSTHEYELFKMYMSMKPAINYTSLAEMTDMKAHQIQIIVSKIKKDVRKNDLFTKRRKEVLF